MKKFFKEWLKDRDPFAIGVTLIIALLLMLNLVFARPAYKLSLLMRKIDAFEVKFEKRFKPIEYIINEKLMSEWQEFREDEESWDAFVKERLQSLERRLTNHWFKGHKREIIFPDE